jgi:MarR family transcriptional regulator, transcriptional regulator for hemolysin
MQEYDFENSIGFIVNRTARSIVKALDLELHEKVGLTVGQWKVIVMLVKQNGLTQKETAERLGLEGPTLIPIIDKMEKEGLIMRKVDPSDRRNNRIYRTEKADALWDRMMECASKVRQIALKDVSEVDVNIMRTVLDKIWNNLRAEFNVGCGYNIGTVGSNTITLDSTRANTSSNAAAINTFNTTTTVPSAQSSTKRIRKNRN